MSYETLNKLPKDTPISAVKNLVELLGYFRIRSKDKRANETASYFWLAQHPDISFVGIELSIFRESESISVYTRTRIDRSYWDLVQQNKTVKYLHDYLGGSFVTDEGRNRYLAPDDLETSKLSAGLYLTRWIFHNALILPRLYLNCRSLEGDLAKNKTSEYKWMDDINPRFYSNSINIPYLIGAWEEYFRASFIVLLKFSECNQGVYKQLKLKPEDIPNIQNNRESFDSVKRCSQFRKTPRLN